MKRILSILLVLLMTLALLAGCTKKPVQTDAPQSGVTPGGQTDENKVDQALLDKAAEMLDDFYNPKKNNEVSAGFTLPASTVYKGYTIPITWTVTNGDNVASVVNGEVGKTAAVNVDTAGEGGQFTLKGTLSLEGFSSEVNFTYDLISQLAVLNKAYALGVGEALGSEYTLSGEITVINTAFDPGYNNVTVTIVVAGLTDKPVQCYRLKGDGADVIKVGDKITVTGKLKNYNGTIEFDAGCRLVSIDEAAELTDAQKVEFELSKLSLPAFVGEVKEYDIPAAGATYPEVTFTWDTSTPELVKVENGKAIPVLPETMTAAVVTVTAKCGEATATKNYTIMLKNGEMTQADILDVLYALENNAILDGEYTLTGVISKVDTAFDPSYNNVTVTIVVDGDTARPVQCYRLKGEGADVIKVGDTITVKGVLKDYKGTKEFDAGCVLVSIDNVATMTDEQKVDAELGKLQFVSSVNEETVVDLADKGATYPEVAFTYMTSDTALAAIDGGKLTLKIGDDNVTVTVTAIASCGEVTKTKEYKIMLVAKELTMEDIVNMAYALGADEALSSPYTLTGVITNVNTAYDPAFGNVTVTIQIGNLTDKPIMCYRMKNGTGIDEGKGVEVIKVGDVITVSGIIKNYHGTTIEYDAGCTLDKIEEVATMTDEQMIDAELAKIDLPASVDKETELSVPVTGDQYEEVTIAWTTDNGTLAKVEGGKLTLKIGSVNTTVTVTATATCGEVTKTKEYKILILTKALTMQDIVDMAYALEGGAALSESYTLTGVITNVNTAYDSGFKNVTVTIQVAGREDKPIMCYRMKNGTGIEAGKGVEVIKVGDTITVSGIIKNYVKDGKSTIEFDANCTLDKIDKVSEMTDEQKVDAELAALSLPTSFNKAETVALASKGATYTNVTFTWASDSALAKVENGKLNITIGTANAAAKVTVTAKLGSVTKTKEFTIQILAKELTMEDIVNMAYGLETGKALDGTYTLTGVITKVNTAYDSGFKNVTVTIQVGSLTDKLIQCFRMKNGSGITEGQGVEVIKVGDTITATGVLKNYNGTIEFDANCTLDKIDAVATMTDEQKVDAELAALSLPASVNEATSIALASRGATYTGVTFTWASDNALAKVENGKLNITIGTANVAAKVTVTAKLGSVTKTKEFTVQILAKELTMEDIVNMAYGLETGKALDGTYTLTGVITKVNTAYDSGFKNVTVTIQVGSLTDKLIQCFRMKNGSGITEGQGVEVIKVGDTITATGVLKNYNGTIEFDANCTLDKIDAVATMTDEQKVDAELAALSLPASVNEATSIALASRGATYTGVTFTWASDSALAKVENGKLNITIGTANAAAKVTVTAKLGSVTKTKEFNIQIIAKELTMQEIVDMAYELAGGAQLPQAYTLTGVITSVDTAYDSGFKNVTVTIQVSGREDKPIMCYRMKNGTGIETGKGVEVIKVGDTITVSGIIKNYVKDDKSTIEFDANCTLDKIDAVAAMTDEQKVDAELAALSLPVSFDQAASVALASAGATYGDVTITWASNNTLAKVENGKLNITIGTENVTAIVTATASCGSVTKTKEFTVQILAKELTMEDIVNMAYEQLKANTDPAIGPYTLTGTVTALKDFSTQYNNRDVTIVVGSLTDKPILCWRLVNGADTTIDDVKALKEGDVITVTGSLKYYNGTIEFDQGDTLDSVTAGVVSDAQKIEKELAAISLPSAVKSDTTINLPLAGATYTDVVFDWQSSDDVLAAIDGSGKLTLKIGDETKEITLTVRADCGDESVMRDFAITLKVSSGEAVTDTLTGSKTYGDAGTTYKEWTYTGDSGAVYAGQSAGKDGSIQMRSTNSNSGIVVTTSAGKVASVTITFTSETLDSREVEVYGKHTAYTAPTDLYGDAKGTQLGSITKSNPQTLTISGDYEFIGLRSKTGALYIESIVIEWAE